MVLLADAHEKVDRQDFSIELAAPENIADIRAIELAGAAMFSFEDLPQSLRYRSTDLQIIQTAIKEARLWVAKSEQAKTVGFVLADIVDDTAHIAEIDVLPDYMRRGIGSSLVQHVCQWASQNGSGAVTLVTFRHIPWNAPFYEKLGFSVLAEAELGAEVKHLMREEFALGLSRDDRVCMKFECPHSSRAAI